MKFIFIAGASASGKSALAKHLRKELIHLGFPTLCLGMDNYYKSRSQINPDEWANQNYDHPDAFDIDLLSEHLLSMEKGQIVQQPCYSFFIHDRTEKTNDIDPAGAEYIIVEGILAHHVKKQCRMKDLTTFLIQTNSYNDILKRREERDAVKRDTSVKETRMRELRSGVRDAFFKHIQGERWLADKIIENDNPVNGGIEAVRNTLQYHVNEMLDFLQEKYNELGAARIACS